VLGGVADGECSDLAKEGTRCCNLWLPALGGTGSRDDDGAGLSVCNGLVAKRSPAGYGVSTAEEDIM
jgi:hypothetical protein